CGNKYDDAEALREQYLMLVAVTSHLKARRPGAWFRKDKVEETHGQLLEAMKAHYSPGPGNAVVYMHLCALELRLGRVMDAARTMVKAAGILPGNRQVRKLNHQLAYKLAKLKEQEQDRDWESASEDEEEGT
ncbi:MAG: hypothetical protein Q9218_008179, partial [Villophora microphyllina]